jgi:hypothetical protein
VRLHPCFAIARRSSSLTPIVKLRTLRRSACLALSRSRNVAMVVSPVERTVARKPFPSHERPRGAGRYRQRRRETGYASLAGRWGQGAFAGRPERLLNAAEALSVTAGQPALRGSISRRRKGPKTNPRLAEWHCEGISPAPAFTEGALGGQRSPSRRFSRTAVALCSGGH